MTEFSRTVGAHLTAMLTAIEHTYGDRSMQLARLAGGVGDYGTVSVLT